MIDAAAAREKMSDRWKMEDLHPPIADRLTEISNQFSLPADYGQVLLDTIRSMQKSAQFMRIRNPEAFRQFLYDYIEAYEVMVDQLIAEGNPAGVQALFGPSTFLSEMSINYAGEDHNPIDVFTYEHKKRNVAWAGEIGLKLMSEVQSVFITGPMNSGKSDLALSVIALLKEVFGDNIYVSIFDGMGEDFLHARTLNSTDHKADKVNLDSLRDYINNIDVSHIKNTVGNAPKGVLVIEEATFMGWDALQRAQLNSLVELAKSKKLSILFLGLDFNFLDDRLPLTETISLICGPNNIYQCTSFQILSDSGLFTIEEAESTSRYYGGIDSSGQLQPGGFNWGIPIVVPRSMELFIYIPIPRYLHPNNVLFRAGRHDLATRLNSYQNEELLDGFAGLKPPAKDPEPIIEA